MKYILFLKWWLLFTVICVSSVFINYTGFFEEIWQKDSSCLSFVTLVLFFITTIFCGIHTFSLCRESETFKKERQTASSIARLQYYERLEEIGWFISELCLTLGMMGTIIGFIMMLSGFETIDMSNPQTIQNLLTQLGKSMATALYTTIVGLVCGSLLKIQYFNFSLELQKLGINDEN